MSEILDDSQKMTFHELQADVKRLGVELASIHARAEGAVGSGIRHSQRW